MFALEILGEIMKLQTNCVYLSVTKQLLSHTSFAHCGTASKTEHYFDFPFFYLNSLPDVLHFFRKGETGDGEKASI